MNQDNFADTLYFIAKKGNSTDLYNTCKISKVHNNTCKESLKRIIKQLVNENNYELLMDSAKNGKYKFVEYYVLSGAKKLYLGTALKWAILYGKDVIVDYLDEILVQPHHAEVDKIADIYDAINDANVDELTSLLKSDTDSTNVNHPSLWQFNFYDNALSDGTGMFKIFKTLVKYGVDINAFDGVTSTGDGEYDEILPSTCLDYFTRIIVDDWKSIFIMRYYGAKTASELGITVEMAERFNIKYNREIVSESGSDSGNLIDSDDNSSRRNSEAGSESD